MTPTQRKAMQQALEALDAMGSRTPSLAETMRMQARAAKKLRAALAEPTYPLPDDLYPSSKDWAHGTYADRVGWLHTMYESAKSLHDALAEQPDVETCEIPPLGWHCTRHAGHEGPCAAVANDDRELVSRAMKRLAEQPAEQEPETQGWQPIETAPKDGTVVDLWHEEFGREADCYWGLPHHCCGEMGSLCDSDWHDLEPGWVGTFNEIMSPASAYTHWMPLPEAPKAASEPPQPAKRKPLTDEEIDLIGFRAVGKVDCQTLKRCVPYGTEIKPLVREIARAIEAAHSITGED